MSTTSVRVTVFTLAVASAAACSSTSRHGDSDTAAVRADTATSATASVAGPVAGPTPQPLTDANILALMDESNVADSTAGSLAATKGTHAAVRAFGQLMMRDHHALRVKGKAVESRIGVTPQPPANDTLPASAARFADSLKAIPRGATWDSVYITRAVADHLAAQAMLAAAQGFAKDTAIKILIAGATPVVHNHLTRAGAIRSAIEQPAVKR